jgi:hypothetical protein
MSEHTKGPWEVSTTKDPDGGEDWTCVDAGCWNVADLGNTHNAEANARLIASAPDLLRLVEDVEWTGGRLGPYCPWCGQLAETGHAPNCPRQAVLAKVRG